jgi:hypothetical protein
VSWLTSIAQLGGYVLVEFDDWPYSWRKPIDAVQTESAESHAQPDVAAHVEDDVWLKHVVSVQLPVGALQEHPAVAPQAAMVPWFQHAAVMHDEPVLVVTQVHPVADPHAEFERPEHAVVFIQLWPWVPWGVP